MKKNLTIIIIMILILGSFGISSLASNLEELEGKQNEINTQLEQKMKNYHKYKEKFLQLFRKYKT